MPALLLPMAAACSQEKVETPPNVIIILADDIGYGDLGFNGEPTVKTPNADRLANSGVRFTNAHAVAATSTPSRYSLLTGHYSWRRNDTGVSPGDAGMIIKPEQTTIADMFREAGYVTGAIGKYSNYEAGTRVPFVVSWPAKVKRQISEALFSHIDIFASLSKLIQKDIPEGAAIDSRDQLNALLGKDKKGREYIIEHASTHSISTKEWKYITPNNGAAYNTYTNTELGNNKEPQLYDMLNDRGEKNNIATDHPEKIIELVNILKQEIAK